MIVNTLYAFIATLGFSFLFNIRGKNLILVSIGGGLGWLFYLISHQSNFTCTFSLFIASLIIAIYSEIMARICKTPVTTFVICAMIPLVPGRGMYSTMFETIQGNIPEALNIGFQTCAQAGAIATGIVLISSTTKLLTYNKKASSNC